MDNGHQNVVFVVNDVGENVEVVSVAAVDAGEAVGNPKRSGKATVACTRERGSPTNSIADALSLIYLFISLSTLGVGND